MNVEKSVHDQPGQLGYGLYGLHQAHDEKGKALSWDDKKGDFNGTPAYVEGEKGVYKEATITVFGGNIKLYSGDVDQETTITFQHETKHDTDKEFIQDLRDKREGKPNKGIDSHKNIEPQDKKVVEEIERKKKAQ